MKSRYIFLVSVIAVTSLATLYLVIHNKTGVAASEFEHTKSEKTLILDAGHGGEDGGAVSLCERGS